MSSPTDSSTESTTHFDPSIVSTSAQPSEPDGDRRAQVIGVGVVGGSIAAALRARGWFVTGSDADATREADALAAGYLDAIGVDNTAVITFVATPVGVLVPTLEAVLRYNTDGIVTDVGSVKREIVDAIDHPRFVGGHPMAGSEKSGLSGVDAELFQGATWVLTPTPQTEATTAAMVRGVAESFGAMVIELDAVAHDRAVATISHVPHVTAALLMRVASERNRDSDETLQLVANGFREMTRIAAGSAALWVEILLANRTAVLEAFDAFIVNCMQLRHAVEATDSDALRETLHAASVARRQLPARKGSATQYSVVHIPVSDSPGALSELFDVFRQLQVNVEDLGLSHDTTNERGALAVTVRRAATPRIHEAFAERGVAVSVQDLEE